MLLASECSPLERKFNSVPRPPTKNPAFWQGLIGALATPAGMAHAAGVISPNGRFRGGLHPLCLSIDTSMRPIVKAGCSSDATHQAVNPWRREAVAWQTDSFPEPAQG